MYWRNSVAQWKAQLVQVCIITHLHKALPKTVHLFLNPNWLLYGKMRAWFPHAENLQWLILSKKTGLDVYLAVWRPGHVQSNYFTTVGQHGHCGQTEKRLEEIKRNVSSYRQTRAHTHTHLELPEQFHQRKSPGNVLSHGEVCLRDFNDCSTS